jgi:hypothetical protein
MNFPATDSTQIKHLWECDHDYYCSESNFFAPGNRQPFTSYKSLAEFLAEEADADMDWNLLFRWDWKEEDPETGECNYSGDDYYRNGRLLLFFMGQRKGLYRWVEVQVCRADEAEVIKYLMPRWAHLQKLWTPFFVSEQIEPTTQS